MNIQLKRLRKLAGYKTQRELANKLGIKERTYASWEREEACMSLAQACEVAEILDCSLDELAGRFEYVKSPRYSDYRQARLNSCFESLNEAGKDSIMEQMDFQLERNSKSMPCGEVPEVA